MSFTPEDLRPNKHEDVLDELIEAGDEEVGPKCQAKHPEQGGLFCLLLGFCKQNFRLFNSWALFGLTLTILSGGVQGFLLSPGIEIKNEIVRESERCYCVSSTKNPDVYVKMLHFM